MSMVDSYLHRHVGTIGGMIELYVALEDIQIDEVAVASGDVLLGGGSGGYSAHAVSMNDLIFTAVEFELFDHYSWVFRHSFENWLKAEGYSYTEDSFDFSDFFDNASVVHAVDWSFSGDEWWEIEVYAREYGGFLP